MSTPSQLKREAQDLLAAIPAPKGPQPRPVIDRERLERLAATDPAQAKREIEALTRRYDGYVLGILDMSPREFAKDKQAQADLLREIVAWDKAGRP